MEKFLYAVMFFLVSHDVYGFPLFPLTGWAHINTRSHKSMVNLGIGRAVGQFLNDYNYLEDSVHWILAVDVFFGNDSDGKEKYYASGEEIYSFLEKQEPLKQAYIHCNGEQILESHTFLVSLRQKMKELVKEPDYSTSLLREYVGKSLYTIQAFYSTTNWVEMDRNKTYKEFGVPGKTLIEVASGDVDTCSDCDNTGDNKNSCINNLLVTDVLTSGYHGEQDAVSPQRSSEDTKGKCGFGGSSDTNNGKTTATGGINKDRDYQTYSPHYQLHLKAYFAAVEATFQFLIDPEIGIIKDLHEDVFAKIFNLYKKSKGSFGFAIDVTGSMGDEIDAVIKGCIEIVTNVRGTVNEPADYVLATFSDPESLTTLVLRTENGLEMISALRNLTVYGGADYPEYSMSGLRKCIDECRNHSTVFVFTDATSKDFLEYDDVIEKALSKNITVDFMLTGGCCRKKRNTYRQKRQTLSSVYDLIATATGGNIYRIDASQITTVLQEATEERFPSATAIIDVLSLNTSHSNFQFVADSYVKNIKIVITGTSNTSDVDISNTSGSLIVNGEATVLSENPDKVVITVVGPLPGLYNITRKTQKAWKVNITAQTGVDFNYFILEKYDNDYLYRISRNPIAGENYTIEITVYNLLNYSNALSDVILTDNYGTVEHLNITHVSSSYATVALASTQFTAQEYQVSISGIDEYGNTFRRTSSSKIRPVKLKLIVNVPSELIADTTSMIEYTALNYSPNNRTFIVRIENDRNFVVDMTTETHLISAGGMANGSFNILATSSYKSVTLAVSVNELGSTENLQKDTRTVFIRSDTPTTCSVTSNTGNCSLTFEDGMCSLYNWFGQSVIHYDAALTSLKGSIGLNIHHTNMSKSPLFVNVSGDCCTRSAYLTVIDENNYITKCYFDLGDPVYRTVSEPETGLSDAGKIAIGVVVGIVVLALLVGVNIAIIVYRGGIKPRLDKMKINDSDIDNNDLTVSELEADFQGY
ncbi:von Willebrand factor A domain-containing protein 7-like [Mytilus galloprovincialis]|uniref:von Willebrand factor A domain-containing protein 7-like n=1 Tax=Mytilus galloprovincialis TaxID=29158 RepID=UPI003F7BDBF2